MNTGRRFTSVYQPSGTNKSLGHKRANLRKQILMEALEIDSESPSSVWNKVVGDVRKEFLKNDNIEMKLHIIDKLAPKDKVEEREKEPLRIIWAKEDEDV